MTEPQKTDHWSFLASDIGAQPSADEPKRPAAAESPQEDAEGQAAPMAPPAASFRPAVKTAPPARRPARPPAWDELAGDLGIAVPPPPPPQPAAKTPARTPEYRRAEPERASQPPRNTPAADVDLLVGTPFHPQGQAASWDEIEPSVTEPQSFEPQEALDIMDETADEFDDEVSEGAAPSGDAKSGEAATDEQRPRRRRRGRGRGRDREGREGREGRAPRESTSGELSAPPGAEDSAAAAGLDSAPEGHENGPAEAGETEAEGTVRRGRRRRGRGRGRDEAREGRPREHRPAEDGPGEVRRSDELQPDREPGDFDDELDFTDVDEHGPVPAEAAADHDDSHDFDDEPGLDNDEDEDGGESPRIGFRNIPTWQDAIGVMIDKNMEARARNPSGPRGPGGRGGRDRGGRGRGRRPERR